MIGNVIHNWTVRSQVAKNLYEFECNCGHRAIKYLSQVIGNKSKGCNKCNNGKKTHGLSNHPSYPTWVHMHRNVNDSNALMYHEYKSLGVKVCDRWKDVRNFVLDMGERKKGYTLTRKDLNGDFTPDNCIWEKVGTHTIRHNKFLAQINLPIAAIPVDAMSTKETVGADHDVIEGLNCMIREKTQEKGNLLERLNGVEKDLVEFKNLLKEMEKMWGITK